MKKYGLIVLTALLLMILTLSACGAQSQNCTKESGTEQEQIDKTNKNYDIPEANVKYKDLVCTGSLDLSYATQFHVDEFGEYDLINIEGDTRRYLVVPQSAQIPADLPTDITILKKPLNHTYLVSTSVMDLVNTIGALPNIRLSGTKEDDWAVSEASTAMDRKELLYAGKYSAPDYELILHEGCNLAIENTMIYHNPEVKEKLESLGIPVIVERSSYEEHPLGRLEWIKLYGILFDKEEEANSYYEDQINKIEPILEKENTGKSVAFFSVTSNGSVTVRKPKDYISQMIQIAGGNYILENKNEDEDNALSTMNMQMEDFYADAKDADILIYNSTIEGEINSIDDLVEKNGLFSDFKAVKEGNVFCTSNNFFQKSTGVGDFIEDMNQVFTDTDAENLNYLKRLVEE